MKISITCNNLPQFLQLCIKETTTKVYDPRESRKLHIAAQGRKLGSTAVLTGQHVIDHIIGWIRIKTPWRIRQDSFSMYEALCLR